LSAKSHSGVNNSQITKDQFRDHDAFLLVHLDGDTLSGVHD
jgi:hypothetical protein